jgi:nucleotidyltransferase/DNA polymerase involved in DNA repair
MAVAKRLCPQAIVVPVRHERYREISRRVFAILDEFSPIVEPLSIDEAFLDLTGTEKLLGAAETVARRLKERVKTQTGLTASVGAAPNKFLAKLASDLQKPDGLVVIRAQDAETLLAPFPVTKIWGIGPAMASRLKLLGISTIGDLQHFPQDVLHQQLGDEAGHFLRLAHGLDDRPVIADRGAKSIGQEQTFETDVGSPDEVCRVLIEQVDQVARRVRKHRLLARTITLKIRFGDFQTITRSRTLPHATDSTVELEAMALEMWNQWVGKSFRPVRLIGATASQFIEEPIQQSLFVDTEHERQKRVDTVADEISERFGKDSIRRGGVL